MNHAQLLLFTFLMPCLFLQFLTTLFVLVLSFLDATVQPSWISAVLGVERAAEDLWRGFHKLFLLYYLIHEICIFGVEV